MSGDSSASPSPAASPPDDLLAEILLRLPPHPTFLLRASLVSKRWRRLVNDPGFRRRFRAFHRTPPVLGFFHNSPYLPRFVPAEGPPGRIAAAACSLRRDGDDGMWWFVDCRHGRALLRSRDFAELLLWDPMTGERRCITVPHQMKTGASDRNAAVLCVGAAGSDDGDCHSSPFYVVVVFTIQGRAFACVYSSRTGAWGELTSTQTPSPCELYEEPGALVGDALYWLLDGTGILEFELGRQRLALVERPLETHSIYKRNIRVVRSEDGGLGLAAIKDFSVHLWALQADHDRVSKWVLRRAIELDTLLPLPMASMLEADWRRVRMMPVWIIGISEDGNVVFLRTMVGIFLVWLETMHFKKVSDTVLMKTVYPYGSFYVPDEDSQLYTGVEDACTEELDSPGEGGYVEDEPPKDYSVYEAGTSRDLGAAQSRLIGYM